MARDPSFLSLDIDDPVRFLDPRAALVSVLRGIETRQHALMSAWGGCPRVYAMLIKATGSSSKTLTVRCPPGVTDFDLGFLLAGTGTLTVTSSADATGTEIVCDNNASTPTTDADLARWFYTGGAASTSAGASSGRAVTVASSASWAWTNVDLTLATSSVTSSLTLLAVEVRPIHVAR